jgi:2'-5' RNA ligase
MPTDAPPSDTARLFVGVWPPDEVRDAVLRHAERWSWPRGARRVRGDKVHMTLHFLGAVPRERVDGLTHALAVPFEPFSMRLERGAVWPGGIAVLEPEVVPPQLQRLHARLGDALQAVGMATERRAFRAHLTLARQAQGAAPPAESAGIEWPVDEYVLIESDLRPPTRYRVIRRW